MKPFFTRSSTLSRAPFFVTLSFSLPFILCFLFLFLLFSFFFFFYFYLKYIYIYIYTCIIFFCSLSSTLMAVRLNLYFKAPGKLFKFFIGHYRTLAHIHVVPSGCSILKFDATCTYFGCVGVCASHQHTTQGNIHQRTRRRE